jgi:aspartate/methionine/tyrosine aminotransferase
MQLIGQSSPITLTMMVIVVASSSSSRITAAASASAFVADAFRNPSISTISLRRHSQLPTRWNKMPTTALFTTSTPMPSSSATSTEEEDNTVVVVDTTLQPTTTQSLTSTLARRLDGLDQPTVWHEFSPMSVQYQSVNLGQGFPDWDPPPFVIDAIHRSTNPKGGRSSNQYARSYAHMPLAQALAEDYMVQWGDRMPDLLIDPVTQIATATGVTNVLYCALQGLINPGDEVLLLEPYFDVYSSQVQMAGGTCVYCPLRPDFTQGGASAVFQLDLTELRSKITSKTRVLIINSPHNPTGKVFSQTELEGIATIVSDHPQLVVIADEVYQHILFDTVNEPHISIATINGGQIWDQTLTMSSAGKTFSCTGWKVGWAIGPPHLVQAVTAVQQWCNFSPVTPTQDAIAQAIREARQPYQIASDLTGPAATTTTTASPPRRTTFDSYYEYLAYDYNIKRQLLIETLEGTGTGMKAVVPNGGFFIMADTSAIEFPYTDIASTQVTPAMPRGTRGGTTSAMMPRDWALARWLTQTVGVTAIPPSAFYSPENIHLAKDTLRFAFCKGENTLLEAKKRFEGYDFSK